MKKKLYFPDISMSGFKKLFLVMKLTSLLVFLAVFTYAASSYSQNSRINLRVTNATIVEVFDEIEVLSDYGFLFKTDQLDVQKKYTLNLENASIESIMSQLLDENEYSYKFIDRTIVITKLGSEGMQVEKIKVSGKVTDSTGAPLPGVSVIVKGTTNGIITDFDGNYTLVNIPSDATIQFSFVGMRTQEIPAEGKEKLDVTMLEESIGVDEVVVLGYGTQRKIEVTSAVTKVKADEFIRGAVKDAGQLIQGKVAGLTISTPSGDPTASSQILLRGTATLATSTQPLILVDGIPGDLNTVAPEDIESIDVLKDGSAAAIYGTRGTNGVILITTKRPDGDIEPTIDYNAYISTQSFINLPRMLTASEYREKLASGTQFQDLGNNTDWLDEVSRNLPISHVHNLTYKGGNIKTNYLATMSYRQFQGNIIKSDNRTINGRVDLNHNMLDNKLKFNLNFINTDNKYNSLGEGSSFDKTIFRQAFMWNPTAPMQNSDGTWFEQPAIAYLENPLALLNESYGENQSQTTRLSGNVTWTPIEGLNLKALVSRSKSNSMYGYAETKRHISTTRDGLKGFATKSGSQSVGQLLELTAEYSKTIKSHKLTFLGGYSYQDDLFERSYMRNWDFPAGDFSYIDNIGVGRASSVGNSNIVSSSKYASNLIGFFGRFSYSYKEKYLLMANLRHEASSKFVGTKNPWGTFPSISVGWRVSEEEFMQNISFLDNLKLRAGYGVTGTAPDDLFLAVSRLGYSGSFLINGKWEPSLSPISNPNPYLKWEVKKETNIGLDFSLLNGRISGDIDYYNRKTDGLLYDYQVPSPPNLYTTTKANVGIMKNTGLEIMLNFNPVRKAKFSWNSQVTFSTNKNELVSLSNDLYQSTNNFINVGYTGSPVQTYTHRVEVGKEIGNFYGYKVIDITEAGEWIYEGADGSPTLLKDRAEADKTILGNGLPKSYANWNNTIKFGNFDLSVSMRGAFGFQVLNFQRMYYELPGFTLYNQLKSSYDKVFDKAVLSKNVTPDFNSYYVEDGDYWKIDNVTLGYNFNVRNIKHIKTARVYMSTLNTFTITGYKGMDPEVNSTGLSPGNDDRDKYPTTRVFTLGLNISFN